MHNNLTKRYSQVLQGRIPSYIIQESFANLAKLKKAIKCWKGVFSGGVVPSDPTMQSDVVIEFAKHANTTNNNFGAMLDIAGAYLVKLKSV